MPNFLTAKEVSTELRVNVSTISRWVSNGTIPAEFVRRPGGVNRGSKILIMKEALDYLLAPPTANEVKKNQSHSSSSYEKLLARF